MIEENIFQKGEFWAGITAWSIFSSAVHLSCPSVLSLHLAVDLSVLAVHSTEAGVQGVKTDPGLQRLHPVQLPSAARRSWITGTLPPLLQLSSEKSINWVRKRNPNPAWHEDDEDEDAPQKVQNVRDRGDHSRKSLILPIHVQTIQICDLLVIGHYFRLKWKFEENHIPRSSRDSLRLFQRAQGSKWDQRL